MGHLQKYIKKMYGDIKETFVRFAPVPFILALITVMVSLLIENVFTGDWERIVERMVFSAIAGVFFGTALVFLRERFTGIKIKGIFSFGIVLLFSVLYYFLLTSDNDVEFVETVRLIVICFSLFAFYIWVPSFKNKAVFSNNALAHFKACFISILYSLVMALGLLAIYFAVDLLLVSLDNDLPAHIANLTGIFFFPLYYLALLPDFCSNEERKQEKCRTASMYPKFLEILVSYIALPLIMLFTGVLVIYLVKILLTLKWPVGQLGPMLLWYSAVGLFLYVLSGKLENRFTSYYRKFFPWVLIPLVLLQQYSIFIRINAYGITESRYYLVLFGIYSIVCAIALLLTKGLKPGLVSILAAVFAVVSILPAINAFSVSRASQIHRLEVILSQNSMLTSGQVVPNADIPIKDKAEITNIMNYMNRMGHTSGIKWLPSDYGQQQDFKALFGFGETYGTVETDESGITYHNGAIDPALPMDVSGFAVGLNAHFYKNDDGSNTEYAFKLNGEDYSVRISETADGDVEISLLNAAGSRQAFLTLKDRLEKLVSEKKLDQGWLVSPADMTMDTDGGNLKMRVILKNINFQMDRDQTISEINGEAFVLVGEK